MSDLDLAPRMAPQHFSKRRKVAHARTAWLPRQWHISFAKFLTVMLFAAPLGIIGGLFWVGSAFNSPRQDTLSTGLTTYAIERAASLNTTRSFDDHYQMYMGVLDVLRYYPDP